MPRASKSQMIKSSYPHPYDKIYFLKTIQYSVILLGQGKFYAKAY